MTDEHRLSPLVLSFDYPPNDGGISRLALGLVQEMIAAGRVPDVVTLDPAGAEGLARPDCPHREVPARRGPREWALLRLLWRQPRNRPVLCMVWNPEATMALLAGRRRVSVWAHGNEVMPYRGRRLRGWLRRQVLERAHVVVCNSTFTQSLVAAIAPQAHTVVVNPAVDAAQFHSDMDRMAARDALGLPQDRRIVLTVSRLDPMKGHETVLRAIAALPPDQQAQLCYVIVGKGPARQAIEACARAMGVADRVRFEGFVSDDRLPHYYAAADLFTLCSVVDHDRSSLEGFGMVFTEAQAAGLPVIGTRSGGIVDAIREGEGGWLIEERDAGALALHLGALVADPAAYRAQGARGRARVLREMTWRGYADRVRDVI